MKKKIRSGPVFSLAFLVALPLSYVLSGLGIYYGGSYALIAPPSIKTLISFAWVSGATFALLRNKQLSWIRTFIHEFKHGILVLLTGSKVKKFQVNKHTGQVSYSMRESKAHLKSYIALAPYFLPLLTLPTLITALILEPDYHIISAMLLGFAIVVDLNFNITEFHPYQTDYHTILGGRIVAMLFVVGWNTVWVVSVCLWIIGGKNSFARLFFQTIKLSQNLFLSH